MTSGDRVVVPEVSAVDCISYRPGHGVHWMQALNSINKPEYSRLTWSGTIVTLDELGLDVEKPDGTVVRYLNHHMERLTVLSGGLGSRVDVNDRWAILRCGSSCFSVTSSAKPSACIPTPVRTPLLMGTEQMRDAWRRPDWRSATGPIKGA